MLSLIIFKSFPVDHGNHFSQKKEQLNGYFIKVNNPPNFVWIKSNVFTFNRN